MNIELIVKKILVDVLQLPEASDLEANTELLGVLPEFDSMAVVSIITEIEENLDLEFSDDEITAEIFMTFGELVDFVKAKAGQS